MRHCFLLTVVNGRLNEPLQMGIGGGMIEPAASEVGVSVQGVVLISPSEPTWADEENPSLNVTGDGISSYDGAETTFGTTGLVVPGISARASF